MQPLTAEWVAKAERDLATALRELHSRRLLSKYFLTCQLLVRRRSLQASPGELNSCIMACSATIRVTVLSGG